MYLLKKVIQLREKAHPDHEKPFLEHLEDLRVMITRMLVTLVIAVIACFSFQKQLMEVLRRPVEEVWIMQLADKLPKSKDDAPRPLDVATWEKAKELEHAASALEPAQREVFYQACGDPELVFHAKAAGLLRAALALPEDKREGFLKVLEAPDDLKRQVNGLLKTAPSPEIDSRGNLKLMSALKPTETFMLSMKLSFFAGIIVSFPLLLMFALQFILPGLHSHEKKVMWPAMAVGFGLFIVGVLFAYFVVLPRALLFFYEWSGSLGVSNDWRIGEYISFATQFTLLFGLSFELPVVVMVCVKLGLLTYESMSKTRSYAILAIFVAAAIITPTPDAFTLMLMALPMIVLYEICIWLAWFDRRKNRQREEQEAREREEYLLAGGGAAAAGSSPDTDLAEAGREPDEARSESDETNDETSAADESGDDGWFAEYPQQEFHDDPEIPERGDDDDGEPGKNPDDKPDDAR